MRTLERSPRAALCLPLLALLLGAPTPVAGQEDEFRDIWQIFAAILGVKTRAVKYNPDLVPSETEDVRVFLTGTRPALDGNYAANVINVVTQQRERWSFDNHQVGIYDAADTSIFFDPTFGLTGPYDGLASLEGNLFCKVYNPQPGPVYEADVLSPPPAEILIWDTGREERGWRVKEYGAGPPEWAALLLMLRDLVPSGDRRLDADLEDAAQHVGQGMALEYWPERVRLSAEGRKVFSHDERAVHALLHAAQRPGPPGGGLQNAILYLVGTAEALAQTALDDAEAVCGGGKRCQREIDRAEREMLKAFEDWMRGEPAKAIAHYGKAFGHAWRAIGRAPWTGPRPGPPPHPVPHFASPYSLKYRSSGPDVPSTSRTLPSIESFRVSRLRRNA